MPGRFEPVDEGQPFAVLVDYAHTPDSLENVLRAARELASGRVIAVFGAGGDRDRGKRPLMGEIGARLADIALVTSDNPRSEDPQAIIAEILGGRRPRARARRRPPALDPARGGPGRAGRRRGHRRQGARAGPGVRGRPQGAVRRRDGGARGAALVRDAAWIAEASGARLVRGGDGAPRRVIIDSREVGPGDLFVGLAGTRSDGGEFARAALEAGAWGVLVTPRWADGLDGVVLAAEDPLAALGALGRAWRRELGASVIAVTGSVGKTSTKELIAALVAPRAVGRRLARELQHRHRDAAGDPRRAAEGTEVLVLEAAMRGFGQIADLAAISEPDVGVITNIGPVHLEQVGSLEGVARAKAELLEGVATAVVPAGEPLLEPYLRRPRGRALRRRRRRPAGRRHRGRARRAARPRARVHRPPSPRQRARRGGGGAGRRRPAVGTGRAARRPPARRARGAPDRGDRDQRLLQRQPSVHARRPR